MWFTPEIPEDMRDNDDESWLWAEKYCLDAGALGVCNYDQICDDEKVFIGEEKTGFIPIMSEGSFNDGECPERSVLTDC